MKNNLLLIISKIHTKKFYITKKLFIRCCSIFFMKMFPCPDTGMFFCFMNRSVCIFCCIHKSNISFINFRFFIKKCKNSLCSGKRHCYEIHLLANLADWHIQTLIKCKETCQRPKCKTTDSINRKNTTDDCYDNITDISNLCISRHSNIGKLVCIISTVEQFII